MKHCPACNFSFPDFHRVCDFDGTELITDPERQSLMKVPKSFPAPRRSLKTPMLLTSLAVLGVFLSAVLIGYLESPGPSIPAIVKEEETQNSRPSLTPVANTTGQFADMTTTEPARPAVVGSRNKSRFSTARLRQKDVADRRSRSEVIARTQDPKRTSNEKSPKIVAVLKTTWRVLKKPFDF